MHGEICTLLATDILYHLLGASFGRIFLLFHFKFCQLNDHLDFLEELFVCLLIAGLELALIGFRGVIERVLKL